MKKEFILKICGNSNLVLNLLAFVYTVEYSSFCENKYKKQLKKNRVMEFKNEEELGRKAKKCLQRVEWFLFALVVSFVATCVVVIFFDLQGLKMLLAILLLLDLVFAYLFYSAEQEANKEPIYQWLRLEYLKGKQSRGKKLTEKERKDMPKLKRKIQAKLKE